MDIPNLIEKWLEYYNRHYPNYIGTDREPRKQMKQFFFNSFNLLDKFGEDWVEYLEYFKDMFLRDPTNDWYSKRHVEGEDSEIRDNVAEWITTFEIIGKVGYPSNKSAKEDLLRYADINLSLAKNKPDDQLIDILFSSAIKNIPTFRKRYAQFYIDLVKNRLNSKAFSVHSLVAYLNTLCLIDMKNELIDDIKNNILLWINSEHDNPRAEILKVSRLITQVDWSKLTTNREDIMTKLKKLFLSYLSQIRRLDLQNIPLHLQAAYHISDNENKTFIRNKISTNISPVQLFQLQEIFDFLEDKNRIEESDTEVEKIPEKCRPNPTKELCKKCMTEKQGLCWTRILAKLLNVPPGFHDPYEVADTVIYTRMQGIYFVIKSKDINNQRGEGDTLYRQCASLFNKEHSLVFYLNPNTTAPAIIENIKNLASTSNKTPKFIVIDKKYINQIYAKYKAKFE